MWLTRLALRYPISTFLIAATILVLGLVSLGQLPIDLLPDISIPTVSVSTSYPGASPLDMEQTVTTAIERAVSSINNVDYIQSTTQEGSSQVRINFNWGTNTDVAMVDAIQRVNQAQRRLPDGVSVPIVRRFDVTSQSVCNVVVYGSIDERDLYDLAVNVIEPQIEHLPGVATAPVTGGKIREIHVTLDRNRLEALDIPVQDVLNAVSNANVIVPSGDMQTGPFDYSLKTDSKFNQVEPIGNIVVTSVNGVPIRVRAVGKVEDSYQEQTGFSRINGQPGLTLRVQKLANANTVAVVDNVRKALPRLSGVPASVRMSMTADQSRYIRQTIRGLAREALMGALLAMLVILLFLRSVRGTLIVVTAIPLSILITFIMFRFGNVTLNIMTFGGLALAVGRLVDDSIVELEAISRHYNLRREGQTKVQATLEAAQEVAAPIFVSTLTTVIVFLPVVFLSGVAKLLFIPLTVTIAVALFGSFFVSRTVTPLMCLHYLTPEETLDRASGRLWERVRIKAHDWIETLDVWYEARLRWALVNRKKLIMSITGLALLSGLLLFLVGTEFFPDQDESQMRVNVRLPVGSRTEQTDKVVAQVERILEANVPEIETVISDIGSSGRNTGSHAASLNITLKPSDQRRRSVFEIVRAVRPLMARVPGASIFLSSGGFMRFLLNFGAGAPIDVEVQGFDMEAGSRLAGQVADIVRAVPGATDVQVSREENLPELRIRIDRDKAGVLGVSMSEVANTINTCIGGTVASIYTDPVSGNAYNILVRLDQRYRSNPADLERIMLHGNGGAKVLLGAIAAIEPTKAPVQITRKNQERLVDVTANVEGRSLGSVATDINRRLQRLTLPAGFTAKLKGNVEQQQKTFRDLMLAFLLAIMLVYVVMASQFQSFLDPFIIMFTVPLGIVGVFWTLFLTGTTLSVTSFQGVIVMVGIVVSNGILLVDYTNHLRGRGLELQEAVVVAGRTRLKPILMTTLTTVIGLLPMAIGMGGESTQAPLAVSVIGGLTVSTVLTLFFVPSLYVVFENRFKRELRKQR